VAEARALLAVPGVVGVNLSGLASDGGEDAGARVKAEVAAAISEAVGELASPPGTAQRSLVEPTSASEETT
jgi:hypothetical protein